MVLTERLNKAQEKLDDFLLVLNKQRGVFKYFAIHRKFLPNEIVRFNIFPQVFDADYMFCKFLEDFDAEHYRFTNFHYLRNRLTKCIYKEVSSSLMVKFELFGSLNTLPMPYDSEEENYNSRRLHTHLQTFIYQYMKAQDFKDCEGVLNYLEMRDIFMNQHNTLKEERDRLALLVTKRTQSLECLKDYESTFIIIKDIGILDGRGW